ncbi:MAG: hypothetical protein ACRD7E_11580 [Bryobacteraceae bacterium]
MVIPALARLLPLALILVVADPLYLRAEEKAPAEKAPTEDTQTEETPKDTREQQKDELLDRIAKLQDKVPDELQTSLALISMKLATGYCSPYRVDRFEKRLAGLDHGEREKFAEEWKLVKEHPLWPSIEDLPNADESK